MRKILLIIALCLSSLFVSAAVASQSGAISITQMPNVIRPGKYYTFVIHAQQDMTVSAIILDQLGEETYTVYQAYPLRTGENELLWDGLQSNQHPVDPGEYLLRIESTAQGSVEVAIRIGSPYPLIQNIRQSTSHIDAGNEPMNITFTLTEAGTLDVQLISVADNTATPLSSINMPAGDNSFQWRGMLNNQPVPDGQYILYMVLRANGGTETIPHRIVVEVQRDAIEPTPAPSPSATVEPATQSEAVPSLAPVQTDTPSPEPTLSAPSPATAAPLLSPPYSSYDDGTFWSMTPGELDDDIIWDILTQPITVYDGGLAAAAKTHAYMMENPDGTGNRIAQLHAQSQGLHVIGTPNEYGYVLVEAFSNYDNEYNPKTDEEKIHAFDLKQGYVQADHLKTVDVKTNIAFLVDKLTQRMYMFIDGVRVTEFLIATGKIADEKYYNETIAGEYITISHTGGFWSGNMYCDLAIRINGGILLHEVPYKQNADGTKNYASFEAYLGTKQSHGCIRIQRLNTPEGYNHKWIWENLDRKGGHKVIIWDDLNRYDSPVTWQENPS